ncbi:3-methyladenine DNA glycosylase [Williamsia sp. MIQD14]|uniref:3-methyladenine DNA glycosylase n=1 Tax=Williamsia sp. MIQD14 TaxID=3425703 RepID=UPI003DA19CB7
MSITDTARVLTPQDWAQRAATHRDRVDALLAAHPQQTAAGEAHPVWQFLFRYYSHKPAHLRRWHPGFGVALLGDPPHRKYPHYVVTDTGHTTVDPAHLADRLTTVGFVHRLLAATESRAPRLNCFGLHEWAMVYRSQDDRRHLAPLRLSDSDTDAVVEAADLRCTHFDAFRFFTDDATGRNVEALSRSTQVETEQPGCVHAGMDLYKWAHKLVPLIDSETVVDALELAFALRELDMRASPYDLAALGFAPIEIESARGRAEYVRLQAASARRAAVLRRRLIDRCAALISPT